MPKATRSKWLLKTGLAGGLPLLAFLFWWFASSWRFWRGELPNLIARAATIASAAVLAHSLVD